MAAINKIQAAPGQGESTSLGDPVEIETILAERKGPDLALDVAIRCGIAYPGTPYVQ